ncbi:MAG TPA: protein-L-isoaspartate O-methyltransferase [Pseudolabrys sp.]|nr:protein-L-isoaspartate O-methyltransferase [Pseudolabrys sp.]
MTDFAAARRHMVDGQVRTADVTDLRIISAMLEVPRERFVPPQAAGLAYLDLGLPLKDMGAAARSLLKPMVLAKLIQAADLAPDAKVLVVGCATGYSAAVLARIAGQVVALEQDEKLAPIAQAALAGIPNVSAVKGPLAGGWAKAAPYDAILIDGAVEEVPEVLSTQLKDGGRLVCVLGASPGASAMLYRKSGLGLSGRAIFDAAATVLPGFAKAQVFAF